VRGATPGTHSSNPPPVLLPPFWFFVVLPPCKPLFHHNLTILVSLSPSPPHPTAPCACFPFPPQVLPADPTDQLELAHRIANMAFVGKVQQLERENAQLQVGLALFHHVIFALITQIDDTQYIRVTNLTTPGVTTLGDRIVKNTT
jgi:hypothetical protein